MKLSISKISIFATTILLLGCSSFLEEEPLAIITEDDFYKTELDAENALNAIYANFDGDGIYGDTYWHVLSLASDEGIYSGGDAALSSISNFSYGVSNEEIEDLWIGFYQGISAANIVLSKVPDISMDDARKEVILGEAYFFRGLFYSDLYRLFRFIPLALETPFDSDDITSLPQANSAAIMDRIVSDLENAQQMLPATSDWGRPNSLAAAGALARIYYFSGNSPEAFIASQTVMDALQYSLVTDVNDLFRNGNSSNSEYIFPVTRSADNEGHINIDLLPESLSGLGDFRVTDMTVSLYEVGDRRAEAFIHQDNGINYPSKYWDELNEPVGGISTVDLPVIRYADILLIYADAVNEINNGPTTEAYQAINSVRARARNAFENGMLEVRTVLPDLSGLDYSSFKAAVEEERQREFLWEGSRWLDLSRTSSLVDKVTAAKPTANPQTRNLIFPIPQSEVVINNWVQNDGY